jgi:hypothetical protein
VAAIAARRDAEQATHAVFLSGNGPLVAVLREALTRDELARQQSRGVRVRKGKVGERVKAFIQNVHHFRDDILIDAAPPAESCSRSAKDASGCFALSGRGIIWGRIGPRALP